MAARIEQSHQRFRNIVKGKIRDDLRKFIQRRDILAREGKRIVSIPMHDIDTPTFRYGDNSSGVGMGEGEGQPGSGAQGGEEQGNHVLEVDITLEELADMLADELKLPRIEPRGSSRIVAIKDKYTGIRQTGPAALRHFKRTYREALKRQMMLGDYDPSDPVIIPIKRDMRYRSWNEVAKPQNNAVIIAMMDVSGSMGNQQKEIVRLAAFWIDTWLRRNYDGIATRFIVHDITAAEVDKETFFTIREDGGTRISSAYNCAADLIDNHYPPNEWNIYCFHFSDGDNSSESDNHLCVKILNERLIPKCNMVGYCQVASSYGSGSFINVLHKAFPESDGATAAENPEVPLITARINARDEILDALRTFFAAGR
ncbi:MAG: DUF444 family protein [Phycisphaerales bacterium]